jgi:hypothetical protein
MKNLIEEYGRNAGKIWETLNSNGALSQTKLIKDTKVKNDEFYGAVGWLARENKINIQYTKYGSIYNLGDTNLLEKIGNDAGVVWNTLNMQGKLDISSLVKYSDLKNDEVFAALGWLAREDKIDGKYSKNKKLTFELKNNCQEIKTTNPVRKKRGKQ